jgi:hypothetical protein
VIDPFDELDAIGLSWGDVGDAGKVAFPYIHQAGAGVLNAFGAGAVVKPLETLEQRGGLLPSDTSPTRPNLRQPSAPSLNQRLAAIKQAALPKGAHPMGPAPSSPLMQSPPPNFLERYQRSLTFSAVALVGVGLVGVLVHYFAGKKQ